MHVFRKLKEFNQVMITKLGWMFTFDQDILCFNFLSDKGLEKY